ncbi:methionyl-tRNA formyltransferase [Oscillatoria sp. CS-180]|uniref:methionyl-tRNA formyltransferase n=1 Tax=Oscillatoria sp. CS-180 TaxID=3021720 RepID=UPI00232AF679|nr:methionyl-tRNA formyltransferase [Oscillatoria sp. CS-180]MDB9524903.1 methionyl-tRNA formyltransferase [Oscillatoria sp. CS-180]
MRIVYLGTPQFAVPSLETFIAHPDFEVMAVVTQPDKRRGRGKQVSPSPVKAIATAANIPVWQPQRIKKDTETLEKLASVQADAFVVVAYGQILSADILEMPRLGCINAHGSLLPKYRGAAPIQWCLYHGESETGITTMQMDVGMDTGPALLDRKRTIGLLDNAWDLAQDLAAMSADLLPKTLDQLNAGTLTPVPQNDDEATYASLIQKDDYWLDWNKPAIQLHNQIRGFYPNCLTKFRSKDLKIEVTVPLGEDYWSLLPATFQDLQSVCETAQINGEPGTVVAIAKGTGPIIQTGDGLLLLHTVKPSGKKAQTGWDFANGNRIDIGEYLSSPV